MNKRITAYARAFGVVGAMSVLAAGATYAAFSADAELVGTTMTSATADLDIATTDGFDQTAQGFTVSGLVPGEPSKEFSLYLRNQGGVPLTLNAEIEEPVMFSGLGGEPGSTSQTPLRAVIVTITDKSVESGEVITTDLYEFTKSDGQEWPGAPLSAGATGSSSAIFKEGNYSVQFELDSSKVEGESASVEAFDIKFTGTHVVEPDTGSEG